MQRGVRRWCFNWPMTNGVQMRTQSLNHARISAALTQGAQICALSLLNRNT
jgi:hypothetical protein